MNTKICLECGEIKHINQFWKNKNSKDGLNPRCSHCCIIKKNKGYKERPWTKTMRSLLTRGSVPNSIYCKKNIKNYLTMDDLKNLWFRDRAWLLKSPSIDRIDSDKDYTIDNCRYIERSINARLGGLVGGKNHISKKGEQHWASKLTDKDVMYIRQSKEGSVALGKRFGVHRTTIRKIRCGLKWKHLPMAKQLDGGKG